MDSRMKHLLVLGSLALAGPSPAAQPQVETAVLAGGCFWGMEAVFERVKGVRDVVSGYAGGDAADATYDKVSSERTRHAEAVRVTFDPKQVSYADLLKIYFTVAHDPTQLNRQYPDVGPSYRSAIFPQTAQQRALAAQSILRLNAVKAFGKPVATKIETGRFYAAEVYHQDFARRNPRHPYIVAHDAPKVARLKKTFPQFWKS
jgi:peptide-methionine (S)-S-oxide reductase